MLPELGGRADAQRNALNREYSSGESVLSLAATAQLLKRNRLMVEDRNLSPGEELLR
jgi:hypothetical protein